MQIENFLSLSTPPPPNFFTDRKKDKDTEIYSLWFIVVINISLQKREIILHVR